MPKRPNIREDSPLKLHLPDDETYLLSSSSKQQRTVRAAVLGSLTLVALGLAGLLIDLPVALYFLQERCPKIVREFVELFEAFSHAFGVLTILVTIYWLDPHSRPLLPRIGCAAIGAGLVANCGKLLISRTRPKYFDFVGGVEATFGDWFPVLEAGTSGQGFPSAHAATAFGLAVLLGWRYERGRWLFLVMASLAGLQRVAGYAHFVSDSLIGGAIGYAVGHTFLLWRPLAAAFFNLEQRLSRNAETAITRVDSDTRLAA